jgi:hypothetical protein
MAKKPDQLDLRTDKVDDPNLRDNFQAIEEYLQSQNLLAGQWRYFEVEYFAAENEAKFPHYLNFIPRDIIITSLEGDQRISWNYKKFGRKNVNLNVSGPCRIRGFLGKYSDNRESTLGTEPLPLVSGGGAATSHSVLTDLANDDHLQYLTESRHDSLPYDNPHKTTITQTIAEDPGTDITPAELEQLSDGSNADSLHTHALLATGEVVKTMDCDASVSVNDWVYVSPSTNNLAIRAADNTANSPVIGVVKAKPTSVTCTVLLVGIYSALTITGRGVLRLDTDGSETFSIPSTGHLQTLGIAFGDGNFFINPEHTRIKRVL